jgi:hypothetical protein
MSKPYATRLIQATEVVKKLVPMGTTPANESVARELTGLDPEEQREVWNRAVENSRLW